MKTTLKLQSPSPARCSAVFNSKQLSQIKCFELHGARTNVASQCIASLAAAVAPDGAMPNLAKIHLSKCRLTESSSSILSTSITNNNSLTELSLIETSINNKSASDICLALHSNTLLKSLTLSDNKISVTNGIMDMMLANQCLTALDLSRNPFASNEMELLLSALAQNMSLQRLSLQKCALNDNCATHISAIISNNVITRIDLSDNAILDTGGITIAGALHNNSTLQQLDLRNTGIGNDAIYYFASALRVNESIIAINLSGNHISANGATALLETVKHHNYYLETVALFNNAVEFHLLFKISKQLIANYKNIWNTRLHRRRCKAFRTTFFWFWLLVNRPFRLAQSSNCSQANSAGELPISDPTYNDSSVSHSATYLLPTEICFSIATLLHKLMYTGFDSKEPLSPKRVPYYCKIK